LAGIFPIGSPYTRRRRGRGKNLPAGGDGDGERGIFILAGTGTGSSPVDIPTRDKPIMVHFHYRVSLYLSNLVLFLILPAFSDAFAYISPVVITLVEKGEDAGECIIASLAH
jgi:hypothetical protein